METKVLDKKHIIIIGVAILSIIVSCFNATYAYFGTSKNEEISIRSVASFGEATVYNYNDILEGNLTYTSNKSEMLKGTTTSFKKDNVETNDYLLTVAAQVKPHDTLYELDEYKNISYEIYHKTDLSIDTSNFTCTDNVSTNGEHCNTGTFLEDSLEGKPFELIKGFRISDTEMHYFDVYIYLNGDIESKRFKTNIFFLDKETEKENREKTLKEVKTFISNNEPDLNTGLIPVVYNENGTSSKWFVADTSKAWYDYESQWWANAISVDSSTEEKRQKYVNTDGTYKSGTEIAEEDMLAMFVWIPRYSYTIKHENGIPVGRYVEGINALPASQTTPGAIDIKFVSNEVKESGLAVYSEEKPSSYITHPAFSFGNQELSGMWVGKFETSIEKNGSCYTCLSSGNSGCNVCDNADQNPRIVPNVTSLRYQNVHNQFMTSQKFANDSIYGLTTKADSHMMKNSEWGAVAYLSQSVYGKYGNSNYSGINKEVYLNTSSNYLTGMSNGIPSMIGSESSEQFKYNMVSIEEKTEYTKISDGELVTFTVDYDDGWQPIVDGFKSKPIVEEATLVLSYSFTLTKQGYLDFEWSASTSNSSLSYFMYEINDNYNIIGGTSRGINESDLLYDKVHMELGAGNYNLKFYYISTDTSGIYGIPESLNAGFVRNVSVNYGAEYKTTKIKNERNGVGASTTGNIYGIYDMSGGAEEYMMAYLYNEDVEFGGYISGSSQINKSGFIDEGKPNQKYFDMYTTTNRLNACNNGICYGIGYNETLWWYENASYDAAFLDYVEGVWITRGGSDWDVGANSGLFVSHYYQGGPLIYSTFRTVLINSE